ncbi:MAG: hypothetical protein AAGG07_13085 [Planctomycetota bacterium]
MLTRIVTFACLTLASGASAQTLVVVDDPAFGADAITVDTVQGLGFLDITVTSGISRTNMPLLLASDPRYDGWRYATRTEVVNLINNSGWSPPLPNVAGADAVIADGDGSIGRAFLDNYIGDLEFDPDFRTYGSSIGWLANSEAVGVSFEASNGIDGFSRASLYPVGTSFNDASDFGHWLVRGPAVNDTITYQGRFTDGGAPVNGTADFIVYVYDGFGVMIPGGFAEFLDVDVADGLFTLDLSTDLTGISDPGAQIEIGARFPAGSGFYDFLAPFQPLTPTMRALEADHAATAATAGVATVADALSNESSVAISLNSGLAPYGVGYLAPTATRQGNTVVLNGMIRDTTVTYSPGDALCTLPAGFRPPARLIFLQASSAGVYRVDVLPTGVVQLQGAPGVGGLFNWVCLDGISFPVQ